MSKSGQQNTKADEGGQRPADTKSSSSTSSKSSADNAQAGAKGQAKRSSTPDKKSDGGKRS